MRSRSGWGLFAVLLAGTAAALVWPRGEPDDPVVEDLLWRIERPADPERRADAMAKLRTHGTDEALLALTSLLRSPDDRIALLAIDAVEEADPGLAGRELWAVLIDPARPDVVRAAAGVAWYRVRREAGAAPAALEEALARSTDGHLQLAKRVLDRVRQVEAEPASPSDPVGEDGPR